MQSILEDSVLVLNRNYLAIKVVTVRDAIICLYKDYARVVDEHFKEYSYEEWVDKSSKLDKDEQEKYRGIIRSPNHFIFAPQVIRVFSDRRVNSASSTIRFSRQSVLVRDEYTCQYCLTPDHKILTSDLRWINLGDIKVGDKIVGFDESLTSTGRRYFKEGTVENLVEDTEPLYRIQLEDGTSFRATAEHKWLGKRYRGSTYEWFSTLEILDKYIPKLFDIWDTEQNYSAGWLSGIIDGEGWLQSNNFNIGIGQNPGIILDKIKKELLVRSFNYSLTRVSNDCETIRVLINGLSKDKARLLGQIRPERLLAKFQVESLGTIKTEKDLKVCSVERIDSGTIIKMGTSTRTFIADGYSHHNCNYQGYKKGMTLDHVIPKARGGKNTFTNLVTACKSCNNRKANKTPEEAGMKLIRKPIAPQWRSHLGSKFSKAWRPYWEKFLFE